MLGASAWLSTRRADVEFDGVPVISARARLAKVNKLAPSGLRSMQIWAAALVCGAIAEHRHIRITLGIKLGPATENGVSVQCEVYLGRNANLIANNGEGEGVRGPEGLHGAWINRRPQLPCFAQRYCRNPCIVRNTGDVAELWSQCIAFPSAQMADCGIGIEVPKLWLCRR